MAESQLNLKQLKYRRARLLMDHVLALGLPQKEYELAMDLWDKIDALIQWEEGIDYLGPDSRRGKRIRRTDD